MSVRYRGAAVLTGAVLICATHEEWRYITLTAGPSPCFRERGELFVSTITPQ